MRRAACLCRLSVFPNRFIVRPRFKFALVPATTTKVSFALARSTSAFHALIRGVRFSSSRQERCDFALLTLYTWNAQMERQP